ncbi:MAG: transglycosylase domain-containing protein [Erysipelotrichaceae bacterium]|nr:transglycosylase domain-containing protein [Erysipelotrichaceae bacterium]
MFKFIRNLIVIAFIVFAGISGYALKLGYDCYVEAISAKPVEVAVSEVMNSDRFVPYDELSPHFVNAVVAVEDRRFFARKGLDFISLTRAIITNIQAKEMKEGGSTLTQQVAKNLYFSHAPSARRKLAEIFFVYDLEERYSKQDLFAVYASIVYYGDGHYGIKDAADGYYGKTPGDLDLNEASMLAGLPQSPSIYQLSTGYDLALKRQKKVLSSMVGEHYITQEQMDDVVNSSIQQ